MTRPGGPFHVFGDIAMGLMVHIVLLVSTTTSLIAHNVHNKVLMI